MIPRQANMPGYWSEELNLFGQDVEGQQEISEDQVGSGSSVGSIGLYDLPPSHAGNSLQAPLLGNRRHSSALSYIYTDTTGGYGNPGHPLPHELDHVGSRLIDHPELYRQFYPPPLFPLTQSSSSSSDISATQSGTINPSLHLSRSYTRPLAHTQVQRAHHVLREAVSQPDFSFSVHGAQGVRHAPYATPASHRSVSNSSYLQPQSHGQGLRSRGSAVLQPMPSIPSGDDHILAPQASFSSTTTTDQTPFTPDAYTFHHNSVSRFHPSSGYGYNPSITHSQPEPPVDSTDIGEMGVQPHLFMSGLGRPGGVGGNGQAQGVIDDDTAWRGIRGKGIGGSDIDAEISDDEDDDNDEEEEEKEKRSIGFKSPKGSEIGSNQDEDTDQDDDHEREGEHAYLADLNLTQLNPRYPLLKQYTISPSPFHTAASLPPSPRIQSGISETRPNVSDLKQVRESVRLGKENGLMVDLDEEEEEGDIGLDVEEEIKGSSALTVTGKGRGGMKSKGIVGAKGQQRAIKRKPKPAKKTKTVRKRRGGRTGVIKMIKSGQPSTAARGNDNTIDLEVVEEEPDSAQVEYGTFDICLASPPPSALAKDELEGSHLELQRPYTRLSVPSDEFTEESQTGLEVVDEEDEEVEVEVEVEVEEAYHPSGRPMRATTKRQNQPIAALPVSPDTSEDQVVGEGEQDKWADEPESESESDSFSISSVEPPLRQLQRERLDRQSQSKARTPGPPRVRLRVKSEPIKEGEKKPRIDPEITIKVEGLRGRLIGKGSQSGIFDEKLCQLMVDSRFTPKYIRWDTKGEKFVIPDFKAFFDKAVMYVMTRPSTHWGGFEKQLSNHGWKRETTACSTTDEIIKTLIQPHLRRDDLELWDKVRELPELMKWGKGNTTGDKLKGEKQKLRANPNGLKEQVKKYEAALRWVATEYPSLWENNAAAMGLSQSDIDRIGRPRRVHNDYVKRAQAEAEEKDELADGDDQVNVELDIGVKKGKESEDSNDPGSGSSGSSGPSGSEPTPCPPSPLRSIEDMPDIPTESVPAFPTPAQAPAPAQKKRSRDGLKVGQTQSQVKGKGRQNAEGEVGEGEGGGLSEEIEESGESEEDRCVWGMVPGEGKGKGLGKKRSRVTMRGKK